ncbi:hypothetical protein [Teredinibacter turnerae]
MNPQIKSACLFINNVSRVRGGAIKR